MRRRPLTHLTPRAGDEQPTAPSEQDAGLHRLLFLVDGVFAIALTLLAVELRLPEATAHAEGPELLTALLATWSRILGFATSFAVLAIFWSVHHRIFQLVRRLDSCLLWLSLLQLACIAFLPFPTAVIGEHPGDAVAGSFYLGAIMVTSVVSFAMWWYASAGHRLVDPSLDPRVIRHYMLLGLGGVVGPALLLGLLALGVQRVISPLILSYVVTLGYVVLGVFGWWEPSGSGPRGRPWRARQESRAGTGAH
ncbi:MAG: TMEM175 family protein [Chloroflexota bacterium]|nr:TMEM175 family protein [Chloroflexota bacterium]